VILLVMNFFTEHESGGSHDHLPSFYMYADWESSRDSLRLFPAHLAYQCWCG
jgi:hypothetical protein